MTDLLETTRASAPTRLRRTVTAVLEARSSRWTTPLLLWLASRVVSTLLLGTVYLLATANGWHFASYRRDPSFATFSGSWDASFYRTIAEHGYPHDPADRRLRPRGAEPVGVPAGVPRGGACGDVRDRCLVLGGRGPGRDGLRCRRLRGPVPARAGGRRRPTCPMGDGALRVRRDRVPAAGRLRREHVPAAAVRGTARPGPAAVLAGGGARGRRGVHPAGGAGAGGGARGAPGRALGRGPARRCGTARTEPSPVAPSCADVGRSRGGSAWRSSSPGWWWPRPDSPGRSSRRRSPGVRGRTSTRSCPGGSGSSAGSTSPR